MCKCVQIWGVKALKFPHQVRSGSSVVRVYRIKRGDGREIYSVGWNSGHVRRLQQCGDLKTALAEAKLRAEQLATGRLEAAQMSIAERDEYHAAKGAAGGVQLLEIVNEWNKARQLTGPDLMRACQQWSERHGGKVARKVTVAEAIALFLKAKKADGVKVKASYDRTLPGFEKALGSQPLSVVSPEAIAAWLAGFDHPVSRNSHHARVVSLFRWCRKRSLLPLDVMTVAERVDRAREAPGEIGLVTPEQLRKAFTLISEKAPHYVPALAIASLCGMRRSEVHGQLWDLQRRRRSMMTPKLFPPPQHGVHAWLYGRACYLRKCSLTPEAAAKLISSTLAKSKLRAGRVVLPGEIADAVSSAYNRPVTAHGTTQHQATPAVATVPHYNAGAGWSRTINTPRAELNRAALGGLLAEAGTFGLAALAATSGPVPRTISAALNQLFAPSDLLCIGRSQSHFAAKRLADWTEQELVTSQFIVPSPLRKPTGTTAKGTPSAHCRDAVGPRRHIIIESDAGLSLDDNRAFGFGLMKGRADLRAPLQMWVAFRGWSARFRPAPLTPTNLFRDVAKNSETAAGRRRVGFMHGLGARRIYSLQADS